MSLNSTEERITTRLLPTLAHKGFSKKRSGLLTGTWGSAEAQVGVSARRDKTTAKLFVTLSVGVRFEDVERLRQRAYVDPDCPTVGVPIHLLHEGGKFVEWDASNPGIISALSEQIENYAIPFFQKFHDLNEVLAALQSENPLDWFTETPESRVPTIVAILAVQGRRHDALELLDREIESLQSSQAPPANARRFKLQKLRNRIVE